MAIGEDVALNAIDLLISSFGMEPSGFILRTLPRQRLQFLAETCSDVGRCCAKSFEQYNARLVLALIADSVIQLAILTETRSLSYDRCYTESPLIRSIGSPIALVAGSYVNRVIFVRRSSGFRY